MQPRVQPSVQPSVQVVETVAPGPGLVAVRVELAVGTSGEASDERDQGLAAAAAAALWAADEAASEGGASTPIPSPIRRRVARAGLTLHVSLAGPAVALTVFGPPQALDTAVWAAASWVRALAWPATAGASVRVGLWASAADSLYDAVSPQGDEVETTLWALLGEERGRSAYASRAAATRLDDDALAALARRAWARSAAGGPVLVVIAAPAADRRRAHSLATRWLSPLSPLSRGGDREDGRRGVPRPPPPGPAERGREQAHPRPSAFKVEPPGDRDTRFVLGWDLTGVGRLVGTSPADTTAALLTLSALLNHPGGPVHQRLVDAARVARSATCGLWAADGQGGATRPDALVMEVTVAERAGAALRDARAALDQALGRVQRGRLDQRLARGAARVAAQDLRARWARAPARAALVASLARRGRVGPGRPAERWLAQTLAALGRQTPEDVARVAAWALHPDRRVVGVFQAKASPWEALTPEKITLYTRVAVDITCPRGGGRPNVAALLATKYHLRAADYVSLTRAIAKRPGLLREVSRDVLGRCAEYAKLRTLVPLRKALALHEALACRAGQIAPERRRERALSRIFRRFDLDPSVYRPLVEMLREEPDASQRMETIDARCRPRFGPAARWGPRRGTAPGDVDAGPGGAAPERPPGEEAP